MLFLHFKAQTIVYCGANNANCAANNAKNNRRVNLDFLKYNWNKATQMWRSSEFQLSRILEHTRE